MDPNIHSDLLDGNNFRFELKTDEGRASTNNSHIETDTKISLFSNTQQYKQSDRNIAKSQK